MSVRTSEHLAFCIGSEYAAEDILRLIVLCRLSHCNILILSAWSLAEKAYEGIATPDVFGQAKQSMPYS